jgi:integrase
MKLTTKTVAALELPDGKSDHFEWDDDLPRFGCRLRLSGNGRKVLRSFVCQYRRGGASRRLLLGSAEVLSAEQARAVAKKALAKVALGEDPQGDRVARRGRDRLTLRSVIDEYLAAKQTDVRTRTFVGLRRYLTGSYFKPLHGMAVDTVTRRDIAARLVAITREHSSIVASKARAAMSTFFVWAMTMGIVESNPTIGTIRPKEGKPRERTLSDAELSAIWRASGDDDYGRIIKLLILLGSRRQEIGGMCWSEIDLENGRWVLPPQRSKNNRKHELPLMGTAISVIRSVPQLVSRDQLFGARSGNGFSAWDKGKQALDTRSGVTGWTTHDIRRTFSTRLHDLGVAPHVVEEILAHRAHRAGSAGVYNKSFYEREVRAALALWSDHVRSITEDGERKIVPMQRLVP